MRRHAMLLGALAMLVLVVGCAASPESAKGFRLPDGDEAAGRDTFAQLGCHGCHTVRDVTMPPPEFQRPTEVELGGPVTRVKTYGELVTSVINPSHRFARGYPLAETTVDGQSMMPDYNSRMTVQELVDIVAFLQPRYEVVLPEYEYVPYL